MCHQWDVGREGPTVKKTFEPILRDHGIIDRERRRKFLIGSCNLYNVSRRVGKKQKQKNHDEVKDGKEFSMIRG